MTSSTTFPTRPAETGRDAPIIAGPRWYRSRIRTWGPLLALGIPALIGAGAYAALHVSDAAWSGAVGLIGGVVAAPGLLVAGAPFGERSFYPGAVAASGLMWLIVGMIASRRATRHPMATWTDFWRHYFWLLGGIWAGSGIALGLATVWLGDSLL